MTTLDQLDYRDHSRGPAIVFARRDVSHLNLEVSTLWYASARGIPEDFELPLEVKRPFMNFKECREMMLKRLGLTDTPQRLSFMAFRGQRTWYPKNKGELLKVIQHKDPDKRPANLVQDDVFEKVKETYKPISEEEKQRRLRMEFLGHA